MSDLAEDFAEELRRDLAHDLLNGNAVGSVARHLARLELVLDEIERLAVQEPDAVTAATLIADLARRRKLPEGAA